MFGTPLKNVGLFAAVLVGIALILSAILFWLAAQFGFDGGSAGTWIGPFAAACIVAGQSYAKESGWTWTADDRRRLALAYAVTGTVIGLAFALISIILDPSTFAILGTFWGAFALVFGSALGGLISYALARFLLARVVRPKATKAAMTTIVSETEK